MPAAVNLPALRVTPDYRSAQYDGTNAAYIAGCISNTSVVGTPTMVSADFDLGGYFQFTLANGDWIVVYDGQLIDKYTPAQFVLKQRDDEPVAATVIAAGSASVPTLGANAQATVSVSLTAGLSGTGYTATPLLSGANNLLAALSILSHTNVSATQVDVVVKNTGLLSLGGASVFVIATA